MPRENPSWERESHHYPATLTRNTPANPPIRSCGLPPTAGVSTDSEEQINSYKNQLAYYTEKIGGNPAWKMAGIYADGAITRRP